MFQDQLFPCIKSRFGEAFLQLRAKSIMICNKKKLNSFSQHLVQLNLENIKVTILSSLITQSYIINYGSLSLAKGAQLNRALATHSYSYNNDVERKEKTDQNVLKKEGGSLLQLSHKIFSFTVIYIYITCIKVTSEYVNKVM